MQRFLAFILATGLAGCSYVPQITPYRIEIQQGNYLSQEMLSQLKPGMTKDQVRFILGTPLVVDPFHAERWDYVFTRSPVNSTQYEYRRVAVFFDDGKLQRVDGDVVSLPANAVQPLGAK